MFLMKLLLVAHFFVNITSNEPLLIKDIITSNNHLCRKLQHW